MSGSVVVTTPGQAMSLHGWSSFWRFPLMATELLRQIWRGCGTLPHVGPHPGTAFIVGFVVTVRLLAVGLAH
jgi:hypothetical protein